MKVYGIVLACITTTLLADLAYFDRDVNSTQLEQCKAFFTKEKDIKTIHLLNAQTLEFKDEYLGDDPEYKTLLYTLKGCFFKEKYLIYSDFMPDSEAYYALDLRDGKETQLNGMPYLSPSHAFFVTEAIESHRISVYAFSNERIVKVFFHRYPDQCVTQNTVWIDDQTIRFELECDGLFDNDTNTTKEGTKETFKLIQKAGKWEITQPN
ncbi:hypothetical protein FA592_05505 [Sulfurospirillum diekertiae]|uniref:Uncharacterized protein n=1 Tax=Sulfurospirillum diekertiae TaxID=1854492 RepID=A0A6G9VST7_9BACT|nr:hypothetical protein [Sulfurospirillum diekertiae]QIR75711.1 hypothetical protein FA584_05600 [Sulfurospirillum diekertiae]QIR78358.1 hypothetical protein FA592_05505 [Sulfurospirillum diekertiae]